MSAKATAKELFQAVFEMVDSAQRDAYLDRHCGSDNRLRRQVDALLKAHFQEDSLLDQPRIEARIAVSDDLAGPATSPLAMERSGSQIGPFKLLEQIGEGGMGVVYMAEQQRPVRRKVALKIIKPGMDTRQVIARFEAERQALAMMDHPNIAHVLDAGSTDSQRPYFVMELVRGIPITEYCDKNKLDTGERLKLFVSVCQAVQHAHTKGIIHRDLKPSNVLVTLHDGVPVPKIIDFGVAKATNQQLTERTLFTSFAQMVGTPLYMSPEQAEMSGLDVDTRSDIYSLGVLLYELLTGTTPFDRQRIHTAAYDEVRRIIREEEPDKPSTRISTMGDASATVSARRSTDPTKLKQLLRRELDWIVMKALEKDRTRRYETASALVAEVTRYLNGEPVEACPPSTVYRLRKYIQRHKAAVGVVAAFLVILIASSAVAWVLYADARRARNEALVAQGDLRAKRDAALNAQRDAAVNLQLATKEKTRAEAESSRADAFAKDLKQRLYDYNVIKAAAAYRDQHWDMANKFLNDCLENQRRWEWRYLHRQTVNEHTVDLPGQSIHEFAFTPDGQRVVAVDGQGTVRLDDVASGKEIWAATTQIKVDMGIEVSADGKLAAVAGAFPPGKSSNDLLSGILKVFEVSTGKIHWEAASADEFFIGPNFSPDGKTLTVFLGSTVKMSGAVQLRNLSDGKVIWSKPGGRIGGCSFDPQCRFVYVVDSSAPTALGKSTVSCLAIADGSEVWSIERPVGTLVVPSFDGKELIAGEKHHSLVILDAATGAKKQEIQGPSLDVAFAIRVSPDGKRVLTVGRAGQAVVWDWATKRVNGSFGITAGYPFLVQFTPDSQHVALLSGLSAPLQIRRIDPVPPALELAGHASGVTDVSFLKANDELISIGTDGVVRFWNCRTGQECKTLTVDTSPKAFDYLANGELLATGGADGAKLWDVSSGKLLHEWRDAGAISWIRFAQFGHRLAATNDRGELRVWQINGNHELVGSSNHGRMDGLAFSSDGRRVVTLISPGGEIAELNLENKQRTVIRPGTPGEFARGLQFTPDGKAVAAGIGHSIELWDLNAQRNIATLQGTSSNVCSLAFSVDGSRLFSGDSDGIVSVWNLETRERLLTFPSHEAYVSSLAISTDGATLASCGTDGLVKLWETAEVPTEVAQQRFIVHQATNLVHQRFTQGFSPREVLEWLSANKSLDQQVLAVALSVANARGASPKALKVFRGQRLGDSDFLAVRRKLDEAAKTLIESIGAAGGTDLNSLPGTAQAVNPAQWHTTANRLVDSATVGIRPEEMIALLKPLVESTSSPHQYSYLRALAHTRLGQWQEAEMDLSASLNSVPEKTPLWHEYAYRLAFLRAYLGQWDRYRSLCEKTLADFADTQDAKLAERTSKMCLFTFESHVDVNKAGELGDRALTLGNAPANILPYLHFAKGIADLRRKKYDDAIVALRASCDGLQSNELSSAKTCVAAAQLYLAISYQHAGRHQEAHETLAAATELIDHLPSPKSTLWNDWMNVMVVLPEAQALVSKQAEDSHK